MKKNFTILSLLVLLNLATIANALACSCQPPYAYFWDIVSPHSKNAMVRFDKLVHGGESGYWYGKFVVLDKFNTPDFKVNDTITIKSVANTCGVYLPSMSTGDTLIVALYDNYQLYAACDFNYMVIRNGYAASMSLKEVKARIMTITNSPKDLVAQKSFLVYPNPATSIITVKFPQAGRGPTKMEILDMSGKVVKTKETDIAEVSLDVQQLPKGLYLLRLSYNGLNPVLQKWVKD